MGTIQMCSWSARNQTCSTSRNSLLPAQIPFWLNFMETLSIFALITYNSPGTQRSTRKCVMGSQGQTKWPNMALVEWMGFGRIWCFQVWRNKAKFICLTNCLQKCSLMMPFFFKVTLLIIAKMLKKNNPTVHQQESG